ncbi:cytochrome P450 [Nocardiopsis baichengensis]|uniref:cytochrome P450 n=1 Tax=Nocardiopsis baichengensis TaxID=280240 RepID=UPI00034D1A7D|nr:cytochrome P450 [Nocardiopsis baichengensis]
MSEPKTRQPPFVPDALPVVGHAVQILRDPLGFLASLPEHGDLVRIKIGRQQAYVVCHPELVEQVLLDDRSFDKGGAFIEKAREFLGNGLVACPHREHRRQRRLVQPAFHRGRLPAYAAVMSEHTDAMTSSWRNGQEIFPAEEMYRVTVNVAAATLFGTRMTDAEVTEIRRSIGVLVTNGFRQMLTPGPLAKLPTPANQRYVHAKRTLSAAVRRIIERQRNARNDGSILATLLATRDEDDALRETEIYDQVLSLLVAGVETTASALAWSCLLLAHHPQCQERLHVESRAVLGGRAATWEDLPRLKSADRVLTEALRIRPPGWLLTRTVTRDTRLAGHLIPSGSTIVFSQQIIHQRADLFAHPEDFAPDRWLDPSTPRRPRDGFLPFSGGARQCIGNDFAFTEATLVLATIADRWHLQDCDPQSPVRPVARMALAPSKRPLRVLRRPGIGVSGRHSPDDSIT